LIILVIIAISATRFACDLLVWCPETGAQRERLVSALLPLLLDSVSENLADLVALALERYVGTLDSDKCLALGTHSCSYIILQSGDDNRGDGTFMTEFRIHIRN
jgi:hypothetical protein